MINLMCPEKSPGDDEVGSEARCSRTRASAESRASLPLITISIATIALACVRGVFYLQVWTGCPAALRGWVIVSLFFLPQMLLAALGVCAGLALLFRIRLGRYLHLIYAGLTIGQSAQRVVGSIATAIIPGAWVSVELVAIAPSLCFLIHAGFVLWWFSRYNPWTRPARLGQEVVWPVAVAGISLVLSYTRAIHELGLVLSGTVQSIFAWVTVVASWVLSGLLLAFAVWCLSAKPKRRRVVRVYAYAVFLWTICLACLGFIHTTVMIITQEPVELDISGMATMLLNSAMSAVLHPQFIWSLFLLLFASFMVKDN